MINASNHEQEFARILAETKKKARVQGNFLSEEELTAAFAELKLDEAQLVQVREFFTTHGISVGEKKARPQSLLYKVELSADEMQPLFEAVIRGEKEAKSRFIEVHMPMVEEISKLYEEQGVFPEDLIGEGYLALVTGVELLAATETFAEAQEAMSGVVMNAMEDLIRRNLADQTEDMKMLEHVQEVADKAAQLSEEYRRDLTIEELMEETDWQKEDILNVLRMVGGTLDGIDTKDQK